MVTLEDLLARESIRDLVARYNSYGDAGKFDLLIGLFDDAMVMEIVDPLGSTPQVWNGVEHVKEVFLGTQQLVRSSATPSYVRHNVTSHVIDVDPTSVDDSGIPQRATGRSYFNVVMPHGLDHWGRYQDEYLRRTGVDNEWCFTRRRVIVDGRVAGGMTLNDTITPPD